MHTGKLNIDNAYSYRLAGSCLATPWTRILHHHAAVDRSLSPTKHARIGSKSFLLLESHQHEHTSALIARESCTLLPRRLKGGRQVPFSRVVEARPREGEAETAPRAMEHLPVVDTDKILMICRQFCFLALSSGTTGCKTQSRDQIFFFLFFSFGRGG